MDESEKLKRAIQTLKDAKADFAEIESAKSISPARDIAGDAIQGINSVLSDIDGGDKQVLERVAFALDRGHEVNRDDLQKLLNIAIATKVGGQREENG